MRRKLIRYTKLQHDVENREANVGDAIRVSRFDAIQTNIGIRREMPVNDRITIQLKGEVFNLLNHPNYG
jgi:hypothetical protein